MNELSEEERWERPNVITPIGLSERRNEHEGPRCPLYGVVLALGRFVKRWTTTDDQEMPRIGPSSA